MKYMYKRVFRFILKLEIGRGEVEMGRRSPHIGLTPVVERGGVNNAMTWHLLR